MHVTAVVQESCRSILLSCFLSCDECNVWDQKVAYRSTLIKVSPVLLSWVRDIVVYSNPIRNVRFVGVVTCKCDEWSTKLMCVAQLLVNYCWAKRARQCILHQKLDFTRLDIYTLHAYTIVPTANSQGYLPPIKMEHERVRHFSRQCLRE